MPCCRPRPPPPRRRSERPCGHTAPGPAGGGWVVERNSSHGIRVTASYLSHDKSSSDSRPDFLSRSGPILCRSDSAPKNRTRVGIPPSEGALLRTDPPSPGPAGFRIGPHNGQIMVKC